METKIRSPRSLKRKGQLNIEGSEDWLAWLTQFASDVGMSRPSLIDHALRLYWRDGWNHSSDPPKR
jgi:hypothetical protein